MAASGLLGELDELAGQVKREYAEQRRRLSFHEYLQLFASDPVRYSRDAARYVRDMFDYYGTTVAERPWGSAQGFRLFALEFAPPQERQRALVGQEGAQGELYRVLNNLVREGRPNRLLLFHGPNGSAKSTVVACILRALEHYSTLDAGALYRFHWVFPKQEILRGTIGFGQRAYAWPRRTSVRACCAWCCRDTAASDAPWRTT